MSVKICGHKVEGKFPTNLWQHLKVAHPDVFSEVVKKDSEEQDKREKKRSREAEGIPKGIQANDFSPVVSE